MVADRKSALTRRQQQIADHVIREGETTYSRLADLFRVSQMTAYRDAQRLDEFGLVRRVRGGITPQPSSVFESSLEFRAQMHRAEKEALSRACFEMIEPGMSVIVDDGTTLMPLAAELHRLAPLTVMTTFLPIVSELAGVEGISLMILGGTYRERYDAAGGVLCADMVSRLRADLLFLCPSAVQGGRVLHQDEDMIVTKRAMMESSDHRVLVADHSKLGRRALHTLAPVSAFQALLTDDGADAGALEHVQDHGVPVTVVATDPAGAQPDGEPTEQDGFGPRSGGRATP